MYILKSHKYSDNYNCIEILGMPASGKSTLLLKMMKETNEIINVNNNLSQSRTKRQIHKLGSTFSCFVSSPIMCVHDFRIIVSSGQKSIKDLLTVLSNWFLIIHMYNQKIKDKEKIFIWDQGLLQALWSIDFSSTKNFDMQSLLEKKLLPKVVHFTDVDDDILVERALNRNITIRLDYRNREHIEKGRRSLKHVLECMDKIGYRKE